ncbi:MAG: hypothetical protein KDC38_13310 [Planctomycetes bacterium]|nr:hypothetical protein [Planctomycetota bacterium]
MDSAFAFLTFLLVLPTLLYSLECWLAVLPRRRPSPLPPQAARVGVAIWWPQGTRIDPLLRTLSGQVSARDRVVIATTSGQELPAGHTRGLKVRVVVEHDDPSPSALIDRALSALSDDPPDIVVILDPDIELAPGTIDALVQRAARTGSPTRATVLHTPDGLRGPLWTHYLDRSERIGSTFPAHSQRARSRCRGAWSISSAT